MADANEQPKDFQPYSQNVEDKGYNEATPIIKGMGNAGEMDIPEFVPERQVVNIGSGAPIDNPNNPISNPSAGSQPTNTPKQEADDFDPKSKKQNAKTLANMLIMAYGELKTLTYRGMSLTEDKLKRKALKGKFDMDALHIQIPISETESMTVLDYLEDYDRGLRKALHIEDDDRCHLPQEFVNAVLPELVKILERQGYGMSPEGKLIYTFGMDVITTATQVVGLKIATNQLLKGVSQLMKELQEARGVAVPQPTMGQKPEQPIMQVRQTQQPQQPIEPKQTEVEQEEQQQQVNAVPVMPVAKYEDPHLTIMNNVVGDMQAVVTPMVTPAHSLPENANLTKIANTNAVNGKKGKGRPAGSKDTIKRDNSKYIESNRKKAREKRNLKVQVESEIMELNEA